MLTLKKWVTCDRSIKCWRLLEARYLKWSGCKPKLDASKAAGHVASVLYYQVSGSARQKLAVNPAAVTPAVALDYLSPDVGFMICNTICWFVLTISLCELEDINLVAGGWGWSSTCLKGRLFQMDGRSESRRGRVFVGLQNKRLGNSVVVAMVE